jgi:glycosyltransferase involved in cell wall biosynthesis
MRIAVHISGIEEKSFVVQTFLYLARQQSNNTFILITDKKDRFLNDLPLNVEIVSIRSVTKNPLLRKLWWKSQLGANLKKIKADLFISLNSVPSFSLSIPQVRILTDIKNLKHRSLKHFRSLIVMNKKIKEDLAQKHLFPAEKIKVIYPYADKIFKPIDDKKKDTVKKQFCDGSEFFLYNGLLKKQDDLINLLKAYSHFKKRQQSSFKLLLLVEPNDLFEESLLSYKYKNDVHFVYPITEEEYAMITGAAYAVVLPFDIYTNMTVALSSMQAGVPVIVSKNSGMKEIANEAITSPENETTKSLGEQMIKLYTNENFRSELVVKGKQIAQEFSLERSIDSLWQAIVSSLD